MMKPTQRRHHRHHCTAHRLQCFMATVPRMKLLAARVACACVPACVRICFYFTKRRPAAIFSFCFPLAFPKCNGQTVISYSKRDIVEGFNKTSIIIIAEINLSSWRRTCAGASCMPVIDAVILSSCSGTHLCIDIYIYRYCFDRIAYCTFAQ